jgi:hypothetical protein
MLPCASRSRRRLAAESAPNRMRSLERRAFRIAQIKKQPGVALLAASSINCKSNDNLSHAIEQGLSSGGDVNALRYRQSVPMLEKYGSEA